ncbi:hypothetical protein SEA_SCAP1_44 [Streptomyces phage Scap1]|uniref:Uncharacterized protein n=1 Tax=Streptomyces phage Scap1 TaxID=2041354 RepID=A0A2D1GP36_9CAUD|nr:hypothetical protein FDI71_gp44 [Streptomyces phage Scap1]ATN93693.1 hypothetical protein SEA_SCAP1_44 [Streptomyces phage Scap1]
MANTAHGHHIPNTPKGTIQDTPKNPARCGGVSICPRCRKEAEAVYGYMVGEDADYQMRAKQIVKDYVDSMQRQNHPDEEPSTYTVYVVWFTKVLQNWKAILGTTLPDGRLFELTYDGDRRVTYFDCYKKQDNFPIPDHLG